MLVYFCGLFSSTCMNILLVLNLYTCITIHIYGRGLADNSRNANVRIVIRQTTFIRNKFVPKIANISSRIFLDTVMSQVN